MKPTNEGRLRKNRNKRWEILYPDNGRFEITSGDLIELKVGGLWIRTGVEHAQPEGYYATEPGVALEEGLAVRFPCE